MNPIRALILAAGAAFLLAPSFAGNAAAQTSQTPPKPSLTEKMNAYVGCINRLSERSYELRKRYFSWAAQSGPTGKERIIYGTYTIYDTADCKKNVEKANALEPRDAALEAAASAYVEAVSKLEPLLKEADDYYSQENYKDDRMAKGKTLHPRLVAAWDAFASADKGLRGGVEAVNDKRALERLAEIEQSEGRKARYYVQATMIQAKRVMRAQEAEKPDLAAFTQALNEFEATVKAAEQVSGADGDAKIGSMFIGNAKSFLDQREATDAPRPRQGAVQPGRPDDAQRRRRLDGRGLAAAPAARLQSADRQLQSRGQYLSKSVRWAKARLRRAHLTGVKSALIFDDDHLNRLVLACRSRDDRPDPDHDADRYTDDREDSRERQERSEAIQNELDDAGDDLADDQ